MQNILRVECSDKRFGSKFESVMEEKFGRCYTIKVPGPDAGVAGDGKHLDALSFFVEYFCQLVPFDRIIVTVHEDCAGCQCDPITHEKQVKQLADAIKNIGNVTAEVETYIARRPDDDLDVWSIEEV